MPEERKFIFITGGVLSSVGKGIVASSIGLILKKRGFNVTMIKVDPYINVDAGTMNPYMHGEVFVTEDGGETDLDLGHYERFLDISLTKDHNITTGQVYLSVIMKERKGEYLGKCVQIIPHITDEIKNRIRTVGERSGAEVVIVEIGGTVGDIEGLPFLEAIRQMRLEEGFDNTLFIHVALVPILSVTKEQKTKPLQHSVNELRRIGIQPDIIVARCDEPLEEEARRKIALFGNVPVSAVFTSYTVLTVYEVPLILDKQGVGDFICKRLKLKPKARPDWTPWKKFIQSLKQPTHIVNVAMCGKYTKLKDSYISIIEALNHAGAKLETKVNLVWIDAEKLEKQNRESEKLRSKLKQCDGILALPGFGARGAEGKIEAIRIARENDVPFLGICFGMQLAVVEYARHVAGLKKANSTEIDPKTPHPVIDLLPEQLEIREKGGTMRLGAQASVLVKNSLAYTLYGEQVIFERHRHRYEVNPSYWKILQEKGLFFSGWSVDKRRVEFIELPDHYFFLGTQAHPEYKSRPLKPSPVFLGFIKACIFKSKGKSSPFRKQTQRSKAASPVSCEHASALITSIKHSY
ncbi:MAG: CTP synthetase [Thermoprotei archaeon]|nr:MAG: CTP synthetase [Thermoprotei archaeon]RLF00284.1 MAG: CTP synthetase [Thermoprotei archaeon]HDI74797.1 CTP synthase [Thermoprotei archaeon]